MRILGGILTFLGVVLIIRTRIRTLDLTEGQALIEYYPLWICSAIFLIVGAFFVCREVK